MCIRDRLNGNVAGVTGCNTGGTGARATGGGTGCASSWGAQDMIGNVWEWTAEWFAGAGQATTTTPGFVQNGVSNWAADYNGDGTYNVDGFVYIAPPSTTASGIPSAAIRGGAWNSSARSGVFALGLGDAPSYWDTSISFRCAIPGGIR